MQRMIALKDSIFEKSQNVEGLNEKMKYLFKTMHAINKLDQWTQLQCKFKQSRDNDPWYPVPALENSHLFLHEIVNEKVAPRCL